jgi:SAM-dependent methyltransferase
MTRRERKMAELTTARPSLEHLLEADDLGLEVLHPGGMDITRQLADLCGIGEGTSVLDVASGTGESACFLAETLGARVVGVDLSAYLLARARRKAAARGLHIEFIRGDAHRLAFAGDAFDVVISECTTCLLDKAQAIGEMVRVAKPGGRIGIHDVCWKEDTPARTKQRLAELEGERPETLDGWRALFEHAGLTGVRTVDKSDLIPTWTKGIKRTLGVSGQMRLFLRVIRRWGVSGLRGVLESERIFGSRHTGYGIIVGTKPLL